ncbi:predicted protein [Arabidopsis lyrata subsp. lyrata]|uniref:Predicted protein n=1 Tax=Arabidopsis lyrata subsp. lyrata TaxID=81972 RepID=D7L1T6_ARALL|nr:predicted protein [Arabidopsis lyrata subsp. lyrata]
MKLIQDSIYSLNSTIQQMQQFMFGDRSTTLPMRFSSPIRLANQQASGLASASTKAARPDRILPFTNPRPAEGLLPAPPGFQKPEVQLQ